MTDLHHAFLRWSNAEQDVKDAMGVLEFALHSLLDVPYQAAQANVVHVLREDASRLRALYDSLANTPNTNTSPP